VRVVGKENFGNTYL